MEPGTQIAGRYELKAPLGQGGFATVWTARDLETGSDVALKFLTDAADQASRIRFQREARVLLEIEHRNCVKVLGQGLALQGPFLALELVEGQPLAALRGQQLPIGTVIDFACQLAEGLAAAHAQGVTHRDLKPENVVLTPRGQLKILDFGIAKVRGVTYSDVTKTGELIGTPQYMGPEQLRGSKSVGPATDQYALGVMLFEMLEGGLPFKGDLLELAMAHIGQPPPPISRPDCPPPLRACVARLLAKQPKQRFPDVLQVVTTLRPSPSAGARPQVESSRAWVPLAVFAAVALGAVAAVVLWDSEPEPVRLVVLPTSPSPVEPVRHEPVPIPGAGRKVVRFPDGCGPGEPEGKPLDERSVRYVPASYDAGRRHRVLLYLTANDRDPGAFIRDSGLMNVAEDQKLVIVALNDSEIDDLDAKFREMVTAQTADLCVDLDNVVVLAQYDRVVHAMHLSCEPWVSALIHYAWQRLASSAEECPNGRVVPELAMTPLRSRRIPSQGGIPGGDCGGSEVRPLEETERRREKMHGCTGEPRAIAKDDGTCFEQECAIDYRRCHANVSQYWPGTGGTAARKLLVCEPEAHFELTGRMVANPTDFPATQLAAEFLESLPPVEQ